MAVEFEGGLFVREPGLLLTELSQMIGFSSAHISVLVRELESLDILEVNREAHHLPSQHNMLRSLRIKKEFIL